MLYTLFLVIAILYNFKKFSKEKAVFIDSLVKAASSQHRNMILSHHFHIFIFEAFLGFIVSHLISQGAFAIGLLGLGGVYVLLIAFGLFLYQYFIKFIEKTTGLELRNSFNHHVIKDFRVSFGMVLLPILLYSVLSWTFQNEISSESPSFFVFEVLLNFIFVSVLTISCTVIIMLRLLPNREITEPEYLEIINTRLTQVGAPKMRVKWIETDLKNAFVVGLKLLRFSNQTMFIGRSLRALTMEEFDAVIAHELAHVANRHIHKRVIELLKNLVSAFVGLSIILIVTFSLFYLYFGEDLGLHQKLLTMVCFGTSLSWLFINYSFFFDTIRSHEYEADAYAVMKLGASFSGLKSALEKLTKTDEMPEFLVAKTRHRHKKNFFTKFFSTHPELSERFDSIEHKIAHGLPFNYYVSSTQKIRSSFGLLLNWKVSAPFATVFAIAAVWASFSYREGSKLVTFINTHQPQEILENQSIMEEINSKPYVIGKTLMYFIVQKQNPELIDFYLKNGASEGRTLVYLAETKNFDLFKAYFKSQSANVSEDEYYLVLLKTARLNFTEGYRYLVNSPKFDSLNPSFKAEIANKFRDSANDKYDDRRSPAAISK